MTPKRTRRTGASTTIGISLDPATKRALQRLAIERHGGNVSALVAEMTEAAVRQAAFEKAWKWYGGPDLTDAQRAEIDAEAEEGWKLARAHARKKSRRTKAA
jgi:hypothetical protein